MVCSTLTIAGVRKKCPRRYNTGGLHCRVLWAVHTKSLLYFFVFMYSQYCACVFCVILRNYAEYFLNIVRNT